MSNLQMEPMESSNPIRCPQCSETLPDDFGPCLSCSFEVPHRSGIPSFGFPVERSQKDADLVSSIADLTETASIRSATKDVVAEEPDADYLLNKIYDTRNDAWRILVDSLLEGCCLDLNAGFGRRSLALAELADSVYAVDPDLQALRVLDYRKDFKSESNVTPIHGDESSIPFGSGVFDMVIADLTESHSRSVTDRLKLLNQFVADDGSLLVFVNGITRQLGLSNAIGLENSSANVTTRPSPFLASRCQQYLEQCGYERTATFTLYPTPEKLSFVYELGNRRGLQLLMDHASNADKYYSSISRLFPLMAQISLFDRLFPAYLVVGSQQSFEPAFTNPVVSTGRSRSVVLEYQNDVLSSIWKYPNRKRHSAFNEREQEIIEWLQAEETHIREKIPDGELVETQFGSTRKEHPVNGHPLSEDSPHSLEDAGAALSRGLSWLIEFQRPEHRDRVTLTPEDFVNRYSIEKYGIDPPKLSAPIEFFETPIHGDFKPENIYVDENAVSAVIDWEYGCKRGNPVIDAAFYIANILRYEGSSPTEVMINVLRGDSELSNLGQSAIRSYCDNVGITERCFYALLPTVFINRIAIDMSYNSTTMYTNKVLDRSERVKDIWSCIDIG